MIFYKSVASGNDFLHVNMEEVPSDSHAKGELARMMCDRHTGPGADGVIFYKLNKSSVQFEIYNSDGGEAELSGNGMAGLTALMLYLGLFDQTVAMETKVGPRIHTLVHRQGNRFRLNIQIGPPDFNALHFFPFLVEGVSQYRCGEIDFYPVSVGNPHSVVILPSDPGNEMLEEIGSRMEPAEIFPHNTNVELVVPEIADTSSGMVADYDAGQGFRIYFYERGVGRTLASSTGSAAVFAVLQKLGLLQQCLTIPAITTSPPSEIPKSVKITGKNDIFIENSVEIVYKGVYIKNQEKKGNNN